MWCDAENASFGSRGRRARMLDQLVPTPDGFVRAVLPASDQLDLGKLREILGTKDVELATEAVLAGGYPEFELGAVPPLTGGDGDRVLVDGRLYDNEWVVLEAGTHE